MRSFVIMCFIAVACADSGYNYNPGASLGSLGSQGIPSDGSSEYGLPSSLSGQQLLSNPILPGGLGGGGGGSGSPFSGNPGGLGGSGSPFGPGSGIGSGDPSDDSSAIGGEPTGDLEKEFFTFGANDDDFADPGAANKALQSVKQALRVVFIKGPSNKGLEDSVLNLAKNAAQQQTDIYVLNKQTDLSDLANKLNQINANNNHKPEVHFVKYRTPEDAANAQKAIQDQYDALGGRSKNVNGGIAPVINFASRGQQAPAPTVNQPSNSYLPSSVFLRRRFRFRI